MAAVCLVPYHQIQSVHILWHQGKDLYGHGELFLDQMVGKVGFKPKEQFLCLHGHQVIGPELYYGGRHGGLFFTSNRTNRCVFLRRRNLLAVLLTYLIWNLWNIWKVYSVWYIWYIWITRHLSVIVLVISASSQRHRARHLSVIICVMVSGQFLPIL